MRLIGAAKGQRLCRSISPISDGVPTSKEANNREGGGGEANWVLDECQTNASINWWKASASRKNPAVNESCGQLPKTCQQTESTFKNNPKRIPIPCNSPPPPPPPHTPDGAPKGRFTMLNLVSTNYKNKPGRQKSPLSHHSVRPFFSFPFQFKKFRPRNKIGNIEPGRGEGGGGAGGERNPARVLEPTAESLRTLKHPEGSLNPPILVPGSGRVQPCRPAGRQNPEKKILKDRTSIWNGHWTPRCVSLL